MSAAGAEINLGTTPVRAGYEFDEQALAAWMRENVDEFSGPLAISQFKGGQSNPTYRIDTPSRSYVLRRKPPGVLLKGAHAIDREARVMRAVALAGFPTPRIYGLCTDEAVIGTWFYVMALVEGRNFWDARFPEVKAAERPAYFSALNETIATLHRLSPATLKLEDFGKSGDYFARQISRWTRQYLADEAAGRDPNMDRLIEWLPENMPAHDDATCVAHGDFRIDNLIFHPTEPRVIAVLDWELSTLGHPIADFANHAMMYHMPPRIMAGLAGVDLAALNIPSEAEYVAAYCGRTGRAGIERYEACLAFSFFRMAAIFHGIKGRVIRGTASSAQASERAKALPDLADIAWRLALCSKV